MAYIGVLPAEGFSTLTYQAFTSVSGTSFTLDYPVGSESEIEVFLNNVRQEPGVAYTADGLQLTLVSAISPTDSFYVNFQGKAQQTATHPSTQDLDAAEGNFTGSVEITGTTPFWENASTISKSYEITGTKNALTIGPVAIASGVTVTVGASATWTIT